MLSKYILSIKISLKIYKRINSNREFYNKHTHIHEALVNKGHIK